jgi:excisionase family DNA binding protein
MHHEVPAQLELDLSGPTPELSPEKRQARARSAGGRLRSARLALSPDEAAEVLGVSRDYFDEHILPDLRAVRRGRRILIPLSELERWLDRNAERIRTGPNGANLVRPATGKEARC